MRIRARLGRLGRGRSTRAAVAAVAQMHNQYAAVDAPAIESQIKISSIENKYVSYRLHVKIFQ